MAAVVILEALRTACLASSGALWSVVPCRRGAEKRGWRGPSTAQKPLPHTMGRLEGNGRRGLVSPPLEG